MRHRITTIAAVLLVSTLPLLSNGTVKGTLIPAEGATLDEFSLVLGPILGDGEEVALNKKGTFSVEVKGLEHTALQVRYGSRVIHTTLLYGLNGTATLTLKVVPTSTRPSTAFQQPFYVDAERTFPSSMPDLQLHQALLDESGFGQTAPFRMTRFPEKDAATYLMKSEQLYRLSKVMPIDEQRSIDVAYCVASLSLLPVSMDRDTKWVERFMKDLPRLLPPDDPAWVLCAYASWVLDAYAQDDKGLAAYRDKVLEQHPVLSNRLLMMTMSAVESAVEGDDDRAEDLLDRIEELDSDGTIFEKAEELVDQFD